MLGNDLTAFDQVWDRCTSRSAAPSPAANMALRATAAAEDFVR